MSTIEKALSKLKSKSEDIHRQVRPDNVSGSHEESENYSANADIHLPWNDMQAKGMLTPPRISGLSSTNL